MLDSIGQDTKQHTAKKRRKRNPGGSALGFVATSYSRIPLPLVSAICGSAIRLSSTGVAGGFLLICLATA